MGHPELTAFEGDELNRIELHERLEFVERKIAGEHFFGPVILRDLEAEGSQLFAGGGRVGGQPNLDCNLTRMRVRA